MAESKQPIAGTEEHLRLRYLEDLSEELEAWGAILQASVIYGFLKSIGIDASKTSQLAKAEDAGESLFQFMKRAKKRLKGILGNRLDPDRAFIVRGLPVYRRGKQMSVKDWERFEKEVTKYLHPYLDTLSSEVATKSVLLAFVTAENESKAKQAGEYRNKTFKQVQGSYYASDMPEDFEKANGDIKFSPSVKRGYAIAFANAAQHITAMDENIRKAVRAQIAAAVRDQKSPAQLASDIYWLKDDRPDLKDMNFEAMNRSWRRVAHTEIAFAHETAKAATYEAQAEESIDKPEKALYFVYTGGTCEFCREHEGDIVRLVPTSAVRDVNNESLKSMGIDDQYTDIAWWPGKNNVGKKRADWDVCTPAHPHSKATMQRFFPADQVWNKDAHRPKLIDRSGFDWKQYTSPSIQREFDRAREAATEARERRIHDREMTLEGRYRK
jgi:hypothetical protein